MRMPWFVIRSWYALVDHAKAVVISVFAFPFVILLILVTLSFAPPGNLITTPSNARPTNTTPPPANTTPLDLATTAALSSLPPPTSYLDQDPAGELCQATLTSPPPQLLPQLSASRSKYEYNSTLTLSAMGYGPGLGALALADELSLLDSCASTQPSTQSITQTIPSITGYVVSDVSTTSSLYEIVVRQGDILIIASSLDRNQTAATPSLSTTLVTLVQNAITAAHPTMQKYCVDMSAPLNSAEKNPTQTGYQPPLHSTTIPIPNSWTLPDESLLSAPLPTVAPYAPGSVTSPPAEPSLPTYTTSVTAELPSTDPIGPGCGWSFFGDATPTPSPAATLAAKTSALAPLQATFAAWPSTVSAYLYDLAIYQAKISSYDEWLQVQSSTTTAPTTTTTIAVPPTTTTTGAPTTTTIITP
jgi:hypothetical protein